MKLKNPMLAVRDMERTVDFYKKVLGLHVIMERISRYTSRRTTSTASQSGWRRLMSSTCTRSWSTPGDSVWSAFTIRTGISSRSGRI